MRSIESPASGGFHPDQPYRSSMTLDRGGETGTHLQQATARDGTDRTSAVRLWRLLAVWSARRRGGFLECSDPWRLYHRSDCFGFAVALRVNGQRANKFSSVCSECASGTALPAIPGIRNSNSARYFSDGRRGVSRAVYGGMSWKETFSTLLSGMKCFVFPNLNHYIATSAMTLCLLLASVIARSCSPQNSLRS